jgi:hypothetical protein
MKYILALIALTLSNSVMSDTYVNGYFKQDGTYVEPHFRSNQNNNRYDNYSTQGNVNPYNGNYGSVNPYNQPRQNYQYTPPPSYQLRNSGIR